MSYKKPNQTQVHRPFQPTSSSEFCYISPLILISIMSKRKRRKQSNNKEASKLRFRLHPKAHEVADHVGDRSSLELLRMLFEKASGVLHELHDCTHFSLLDEIHLDAVGLYDSDRQKWVFWTQVNQLVLLANRTASRAVMGLVDGLSSAVGSKNELVLALTSRALLEHSAALHTIEEFIAPFQNRLIGEIWPDSNPSVTEQDKELRKELLRFVVGRRVQYADSMPALDDSTNKWKKYNTSLRSVPEQFQATQILKFIDLLSKQEGHQFLRAAYEFLCEYCHPNSASRTLDFNLTRTDLGKHILTVDSRSSLSRGFRNVYNLHEEILPLCCKAIESSLLTFSRCQKPMPAMSFGLESVPINAQYCVDEFGRVGWIQQNEILHLPTIFKPVPITDEQHQRIVHIHNVFRKILSLTLETWVSNMAQEGPNLEEEIRLFEHFVDVFERELRDRGNTSLQLQKLLYCAIVKSIEVPSFDDLISVLPNLKALPNTERVFVRVKSQEQRT